MAILKITLFFVLLLGGAIVAGLWHWVWFGSGADIIANNLIPSSLFPGRDKQTVLPVARTAVKVIMVIMSVAVLVGLYLTIYSMLASR